MNMKQKQTCPMNTCQSKVCHGIIQIQMKIQTEVPVKEKLCNISRNETIAVLQDLLLPLALHLISTAKKKSGLVWWIGKQSRNLAQYSEVNKDT